MTRLGFERHIPDLGLATSYAEFGDSAVHRISPWLKFAVLPLLVLDVTVINDIRILALIFMTALLFYAVSRLPLLTLFYWYTLPVFFIVSIAFLLIWTVRGVPLFRIGPLKLTIQGGILLLTLVLKSLAVVTYSFIVIMTTKYNYQSYIVSKVLPYPLDQIILLAYRFTFLALDGLEETIIAMRSRGGFNISGLQKNGRFYGSVFALAFIRSFDRADRVSKAMESRGYKGRLMSIHRPPNPSPVGYISLLALLVSSVYVLVTLSGMLHN